MSDKQPTRAELLRAMTRIKKLVDAANIHDHLAVCEIIGRIRYWTRTTLCREPAQVMSTAGYRGRPRCEECNQPADDGICDNSAQHAIDRALHALDERQS